ncbi:hypothetical protein GQ55_1G130600 [Panicum hallii var. hallii]|uniref:Uncharacterized protein n=1 Tax=Panicum hallii var. hallii TaxID=1504633 RepID=A0A2T7F531_9POAL|nr:hypothetical protein GQ55_1G130600 [Panicum hallii var. hallii]
MVDSTSRLHACFSILLALLFVKYFSPIELRNSCCTIHVFYRKSHREILLRCGEFCRDQN